MALSPKGVSKNAAFSGTINCVPLLLLSKSWFWCIPLAGGVELDFSERMKRKNILEE
jgi:hypothetical protein